MYTITNEHISLEQLEEILEKDVHLQIAPDVADTIKECRLFLDKKVGDSENLIYGINTGFGSLCNTAISKEDLGKLQRNLVLSHACGMGEEVPSEIVKRMLLLKIIGLSHGNSGIQLKTVQRLIFFYNHKIYPIIFTQGSLGASGDLAPLAHLSLPLFGKGKVRIKGKKLSSKKMLEQFKLEPMQLQSKEGLALLNGTQFMCAYATYCVEHAKNLLKKFTTVAAASIDGYDARMNPFTHSVNSIRKQIGQINIAKVVSELLVDSEIAYQEKNHVQDPYSFRCIPQVHGATADTINHCSDIIEREVNAVTDNPTIFVEEDLVISAGNFHGQPLALVLDFLAIALAELGSISERRIFKLISGTRNLPAFLVANPGLNSGFMIPQYTCASIVSQNKQLCTPASIDTIDSSNGQEDHVSMGANAATKLYKVVENCYTILGIELLNAMQALEFRLPLKSSTIIEKIRTEYRKEIPFVIEDRYLHKLMKRSVKFARKMK